MLARHSDAEQMHSLCEGLILMSIGGEQLKWRCRHFVFVLTVCLSWESGSEDARTPDAFAKPEGRPKSESPDCRSPSQGSFSIRASNFFRHSLFDRSTVATHSMLLAGGGRRNTINRRVNLAAHRRAFLCVQIVLNLQLHHRLQIGNFQEHRPAIGEQFGRANLDRVAAFLIGMGDGPIFRAVLGGVAVVPLFDAVTAGVFGGFPVERLRKRECQAVALSVPGDRYIERFASATDALEAAVLERAGLPAGAAHDVEMAVARVERAAHRA